MEVPNLKERALRIRDMFTSIISTARKPEIEEAEPEKRMSAEEIAQAKIAEWLVDAPPELWAQLDKWVEEAHISVRTKISSHPDLSFALGVEAGLEAVQTTFKQWSGQSAQTDPEKGL